MNHLINELIKVKPYDHQLKGFEFAMNHFEKNNCGGVSLLMEMGCGKSLTSIMIMGQLYKQRKISKVLVCCPLSITGVWEDELKKYALFSFETVVLKGTIAKKKEQLNDVMFDEEMNDNYALKVVIVNYESAWRLEKEILNVGFDMVVADEGHKLKENRSSVSKGIQNIGAKAKYRLLLTGTVITNKEIDVFSQYKFVDPMIFGLSFFTFRNKFFDMGGYGNHTPIFRKSLEPLFLEKLHSIAYRVTKEECLDLPPITEETRVVELETDAMKVYKEIENELYVNFGDDKEVTASNVLTKILRLSQITGGYLNLDDKTVKNVSNAKLDALIDIVDTMKQEGKKVVIMARFNAELDAIENMLHLKKINYSVIRGGVNDREEQIRKLQEDPDCLCFVGQIAAAGLGITLTSASTMVFYSLDYSMSNFEQAKARIHRAGQTDNCHYIYLVAKGTIDRKVIRALRNKVDLAKSIVDDYRNNKNPFIDNEGVDIFASK